MSRKRNRPLINFKAIEKYAPIQKIITEKTFALLPPKQKRIIIVVVLRDELGLSFGVIARVVSTSYGNAYEIFKRFKTQQNDLTTTTDRTADTTTEHQNAAATEN